MDIAQKEFILNLLNTGVGQAASVLSEIANTDINMVVPELDICRPEDVAGHLEIYKNDEVISVSQGFSGILSGNGVLLLSNSSGLLITRRLMENIEDPAEIEPAKEKVLSKVGNIVINNLVGSWSELFADQFKFGMPDYLESPLSNMLESRRIVSDDGSGKHYAMVANIHFDIKEFFALGSILILFESSSLEKLMGAVKV